jgi:thioredoxin 1
MENLTEENFKAYMKKDKVVIDFWADWCGPCKTLGPVFEELSKEIKTVHFAKVNVDDSGNLASEQGVRGMPTLILFKNGEEVDRIVGFNSKESLKRKIEDAFD